MLSFYGSCDSEATFVRVFGPDAASLSDDFFWGVAVFDSGSRMGTSGPGSLTDFARFELLTDSFDLFELALDGLVLIPSLIKLGLLCSEDMEEAEDCPMIALTTISNEPIFLSFSFT